jgi:predicted nuclease of predicted toxin-antitoxin system
MKRVRRPFLKHKLALYFDENLPRAVIDYFRTQSYWKKKVRVVSAVEEGFSGHDDDFHFGYCSRNKFVLVTRDGDFCNDRKYPFRFGENSGIVTVRATKSDIQGMIRSLRAFLGFVLQMPFPKAFVAETKFILSGEGCVMRGRDGETREIKTLYIEAGKTTVGEIREHFSW